MKIKTTIAVSCLPEQVFSWIEEPEKAMLWQKGVKSGEIIKETPGKIGTTFREVMEENGKTLEMRGEITNFIPGKILSFFLESRMHRVQVDYSVEGGPDQTTVRVDSNIRWKFPVNLFCLVLGKKIRSNILRQTNAELLELKALCERKRQD